jgi:hypothetical protein
MTADSFLTRLYSASQLGNLLLPRHAWQPYPPAPWESLSAMLHQKLIASGEEALATEWPSLPAALYLRFARDGDRAAFEAHYFQRRSLLAHLVLAECAEGRGRFLDAIANAIWSMCEESSWCLPAHIGVQHFGPGLPDIAEPIVDLFAAETSALLSWIHFLLADRLNQISPLVTQRIEREIQARILIPAQERDNFWWMGFTQREVNNWNPWINANWLASVLLIEADEARRTASVARIMRSLDRFIVPYPDDGGCDEGPSYWTRAGASLYDCLELLYSATDGKINVYNDPKIQNIARFIYRAHIAEAYYVNFADAPALVHPDATLVTGFGERIGDQAMMAMGAWLEDRSRLSSARIDLDHDLTRVLRKLWKEIRDKEQGASPSISPTPLSSTPITPVSPPLLRDVFLPDIHFFVARDQAGTVRGLYVAAKGGHNAESHNHNDVGHFIIYHDGKPLIIDVGVETYTRKTFSPQRYEIWTMQSAYHSLPTIDGIMQAPGREYAARSVSYLADEGSATFALDLAGVYPPKAHLATWNRTLTLQRGLQVDLCDAYEFTEPPVSLTLSLMTPCQVDLSIPGQVRLGAAPLADGCFSAAGAIAYNISQFAVSKEEIPLSDEHLASAWGARLTRLLFTAAETGKQGQWSIQITGGQ